MLRAGTKKPKTNAEKENAIPVMIGYPDKWVTIPSYDEGGKLTMRFVMEKADRLNKRLLSMTNLQIETYDELGNLDLRILMPAALLNIDASVVTSTNSVSIHRSDFEVTGTNMRFNTETKEMLFRGAVHTVIVGNNFAAASPKQEEPAAGGETR